MYVTLIQNTALLVALSTLYSLGARLRTRDGVWFRLYMGLLFGAVAVAGMMTPFHYSTGVIYDGRSIVLSMAGLFGGLTVAGISAIIAGAFRVSLGGAGVWAGLATIVGCALVGFAFRRVYGNRPDKLGILALYVLGLAAHVVMLGCQLALLPRPLGANIVQAVWLPVMSIYPIATVLMGVLLGTEDRRVKAEEALRESEERFVLAVQGANDGIWDWDIKNHTLYWSPRMKELLGYADDELDVDFHTFESHLHPDDIEPIKAAIEAHLKRREPYNVEQRLRTKSGEYRLFNARGQALWDADGRPIRMAGATTDITERKRAEEKIRQSEETYRNLFHNAQVGLFRTRISDGKILESNEQLARMFGYSSREEFIANYVTSENYVDPGTRERMLEQIRRDGFVQNFEARFYRKDRSIFWARYSARIYPEQGWIEGVAEDITERKQAEEKIQEQLTELQRWYKALLGREERIIELKREVNELLLQAGQPIRYPSIVEDTKSSPLVH